LWLSYANKVTFEQEFSHDAVATYKTSLDLGIK
jgi:hypothetical protein